VQGSSGLASTTTDVPFVRSPRVVPRVPERTIELPEAPRSLNRTRFPWLAMAAPLVMGGVMFAMTQSPLTLIFVALSPIIMIGNYIDQRVQAKKKHADEVVIFEADMITAERDLLADHRDERAALLATYPSVGDIADSASRLGTLLWSRRPEHPQFLQLRLGLGAVAPRVTVENRRGGGLPEFQDRANALAERFAVLTDAPVVADLRSVGALGICGARDGADGVDLAIALQLVALHSPSEVVVCCLTSPRGRQRWSWLQWLPHTSSPHSPLPGLHLSADPGTGAVLLNQLEDLLALRGEASKAAKSTLRGPLEGDEQPPPPQVPAVVVIVDGAMVDRARLTHIAEQGPDVGIHVIWCAGARSDLPAACRSYLDLGSSGARVGQVRLGSTVDPVVVESVTPQIVATLARWLAPVVDAGAPIADQSDLPRAVSLVSLLGVEACDDPDVVIARWRENRSLVRRDGSPPQRLDRVGDLQAKVGHAGTEPFTLALRSQGPHALVGGTTGAGKSEFLQSWVLGMAHAYSPDRVTFLFVDYKGGSAFGPCEKLPHRVGTVTDLTPALVRRALLSLKAELHRREHLLNEKSQKDLIELEKTGDPDCPPSLVIVIDEFAALAGEVPDFVDGIVDVAQRGRSLGLHLIMATQRPAGVIKDNLRANTNLRVALRMADEHDSSDVIGEKTAAYFDPSIPGRGAAKMGPGRVLAFQSAFPGARTPAKPPAPPIDVVELSFGQGRAWPVPERAPVGDEVPKDIDRVVATVVEAARRAGVPEPRKPWLPSLEPVCNLRSLLQNDDTALVLGLLDDPHNQRQQAVYYEPDSDGNILFYGAGGSGKTTALRTLAVASSVTPRAGGLVHVYALDFAGGGLGMLEVLPNVGAVIDGSDHERVGRILRRLGTVIDERAQAFSAARAATLTDYRQVTAAPVPRILLLVDGFASFRNEYEATTDRLPLYNLFQQILADGRPVGVHVAMTADRPGAVPTSVASAVQRKVVFRQTDDDAYAYFGLPRDVLDPTSVPGRAMQVGNPQELQLAILGSSVNVADQFRAIEQLAEFNRKLSIPEPEPVLSLPTLIPAASLPDAVGDQPVLGVADDTMQPIGFDPSGVVLVSGPGQSGRTNAVRWFAESVRRRYPEVVLMHFSPGRSPLSTLELWDDSAVGMENCAQFAMRAKELIVEPVEGDLTFAFFVEGYPEFLSTPVDPPLVELVKLCRRNGHLLVAEGEGSSWGSSWPLILEARNARTGLLLQPDQMEGDMLLRTSLPRVKRTDLPPGRGFWIKSGKARKVQLPWVE
jgi:S-DNA-T family DNA segregation ATPase FtsK/SpoIIIE